ncbi:serine/threonine-protein kinase [Roseomonas marmotae]|uniref:Uncharacterized protein n=1 Tax=Roseomonas marmotae TaxID=2768161 RepID=A0ABS3KF78_9PROT|nr:hypothetical protein [Roseomonas marmotae]MBO1076077.1 hypothetical protein [Roseomonas marmotae]QTI81316.1 hypothetical protein IAI58_18335 [Roseomonas marmotae]
MAEPLHVVGGSVAALVAALTAARHRPVELYLDPARAGGGFAGLRLGGSWLPLGMRLLELDYEDPLEARRPLADYDPARDDHRPFIDVLRRHLEEWLGPELIAAPAPEMLWEGRRTTCALTSADIATLPPLMAPSLRARIAAEAGALLRDPAPPAWRFLPGRAARLEAVGLEAASRDNHGATLHSMLLAPLAARVDPTGWAACPATERRKLWAALFHPRTVLEAFRDGRTSFRPRRPFATLRRGGMAGAVRRMLAALRASPAVRLHRVGRLTGLARRGEELLLDFDGRRTRLPTRSAAFGLGAEEAFAAAGLAYAPNRLRAGFAWMAVREAELLHIPSALLLCGAGAPAFRISDGGMVAPGERRLTIEFGDMAAAPGADAARAALEAAGLLRPGAAPRLLHALAGPAQVAPSEANRQAHETAATAFRTALGGRPRILGGARRFGFESFNDQMVDGLHCGQCQG